MTPATGPGPATPPKQPDSPNYLKWILIGCGALIVIVLGMALLGFVIWYFSMRTNSQGNSRSSRPTLLRSNDVKLVSDHGLETVAKSWNSCTAFAPADWTMTGNEQRVGIGADLAAADLTMFAS